MEATAVGERREYVGLLRLTGSLVEGGLSRVAGCAGLVGLAGLAGPTYFMLACVNETGGCE